MCMVDTGLLQITEKDCIYGDSGVFLLHKYCILHIDIIRLNHTNFSFANIVIVLPGTVYILVRINFRIVCTIECVC